MTDTANLALPLLSPSQAQKHVTVNEALWRLDAAAQLSVVSRQVAAPPAAAADGARYLVPAGAMGDWSGQAGRIALRQNGGWVYLVPRAGWRAFVAAERLELLHDGTDWLDGAAAVSAGGAALGFAVAEIDHALGSGASSVTLPVLPGNASVWGVTGRVLADIGGSAGSFRIGVAGSDDRYGSGIGLFEGSWLRGLTGTPLTYYAPTELVLTAEGGTFDGSGILRIAVHYATLGLPRPA